MTRENIPVADFFGEGKKLNSKETIKGHSKKQLEFKLMATKFVAISWGVDTLLLLGFVGIRKISFFIPAAYLCAGIFLLTTVYILHRTRVSERFRDPNLSLIQFLTAISLQTGGIFIAPQIGFFFLFQLFSVFAFGLLSLNRRQFAILLIISSVLVTYAIFHIRSAITFPLNTVSEQLLLSFTLAIGLSRFVAIVGVVNNLRAGLAKKNAELAKSLERIAQLASQDELTLLANRRQILSLLSEEKNRIDRTHGAFCVAMLDLDHFKKINDSYGHLVGDKVLKTVASSVKQLLRKTDQVGRYGGEEFIILMTDTALEGAFLPLDRIKSAVNSLDFQHGSHKLEITISMGVAQYHLGETTEELLNRADAALYSAKIAGRNRVVLAA